VVDRGGAVIGLAAGPFTGCEPPNISDEFKAVLVGSIDFFASKSRVGFGVHVVLGYEQIMCSLYVGRILKPGEALEELILLLERQYFEEKKNVVDGQCCMEVVG
jgi:hypothetical protein